MKENLFNELIETLKFSYAPYSHFKVCAIVLTNDKKKHYGINVENASFRLTQCAEANVLATIYSQGYKKDQIEEIHLLGGFEGKINTHLMPCGACRQIIKELGNDNIKVISYKTKDDFLIKTIDQLLPFSFSSKDLK